MTKWDDLWKEPVRATPAGGSITPIDPARATRYAAKAFADECRTVAGAANGTRNDTLNIAAFSLGQLVAAGHLAYEDVWNGLRDAALGTGLDEGEVAATLRSGLTKGKEHPRVVPEQAPAPTPTVLDAVVAGGADTPDISEFIRTHFPLLDWRELWDSEDEEEEWIVEPILPARRLVALFSAPKVGKSLLMLEIAVAVAQGTSVLGVTPERPHRVLYVDFENDPRGDVRERLRAMRAAPDDLDNLCYLSYPTLAKLDTAAGAAELMAIVAEYRCEVVVIDTISRAVGGEENENDTWLAFYRHTGLAMKQAGVTCIRLDHTGKDHEKGMRGGSAKYGDVDAVWKLSKVTEETYRLDCTDHRMKVTETCIIVRRRTLPLRHEVAGEGRAAAYADKVAEIIAFLDDADAPRDIGRDGARALLRAAGASARTDNISEAIRQRKLRLGVTIQEEL